MSPKWIIPLRKIARIWSGVVISLGILIFFAEISDPHLTPSEPSPWWESLLPISLALSVVGLALAWKWEAIGGGMTVGFAVLTLLLYQATGRTHGVAVALILLPVLIPGMCFLACWWGSGSTNQEGV